MAEETLLQTQLDEANQKIETLTGELEKEKAAHKKTMDDALSMNGELQKQLDKRPVATTDEMPSVDLNGVTYRCKYKALKIGDDTIKAEDLVADKELCSKLVAEKNGMLKRI